jgi:hypothetical protein
VKPRRGPSKPIQASAFRSPTCAQPRCTAAQAAAARDSATRLLRAQPGFTVSPFRSVVGVNPSVFDLFASAWLDAGVPA